MDPVIGQCVEAKPAYFTLPLYGIVIKVMKGSFIIQDENSVTMCFRIIRVISDDKIPLVLQKIAHCVRICQFAEAT
jgi:hypothetical protein